jgi:hypothetical protein
MKNCDYILVKIDESGICIFKPYYKEDLEDWFLTKGVKQEECLFLEDFEEYDTEYPDELIKYIIIKGEIVLPKEEKVVTKLTL